MTPIPSASTTALRTLLRTPPSLRPHILALAQQQHRQQLHQPSSRAAYHSHEHPAAPPYREPEAQILSAALAHVPTHGFTRTALALGARDAGYLDISTNLFPRGAFELVQYHLVTQRLGLAQRLRSLHDGSSSSSSSSNQPLGRRVREIVLARLRANVETIDGSTISSDGGILPHWQQALGLMSLAENIPASLRELAALSDEIWYLAGDTAVDASWYSKRASLAAVYAATEVFQTTDQSEGFRDTEEFLDRRLGEVRMVGGAVGGTMEWLGFQGTALVSLLRSKGVRI